MLAVRSFWSKAMKIKTIMLGILLPSLFLTLSGCDTGYHLTFSKYRVVEAVQTVEICGINGVCREEEMKFDTGAWRCSIDESYRQELGVPIILDEIFQDEKYRKHCEDHQVHVTSGTSLGECRDVSRITFYETSLDIKVVADFTIAKDRSHLETKALCGRKMLKRHRLLVESLNGPKGEEEN